MEIRKRDSDESGTLFFHDIKEEKTSMGTYERISRYRLLQVLEAQGLLFENDACEITALHYFSVTNQ